MPYSENIFTLSYLRAVGVEQTTAKYGEVYVYELRKCRDVLLRKM